MSKPELSSREQLVHAVVLLCSQGISRRAIARSLGVARKTVSRILDQHQAVRSEAHTALPSRAPRAPRPSKLDAFQGGAQRLIESFPDITAQRMFEELRGKGFCGGYTAVKLLVRKLRPKPRVEPSRPTPSYGPGKMAECDWSPYTIEFTHAPARTLQGFAYALVYSHRKHFDFFERNDLHALMDGHVGAYTHFGGAAHTTKYDVQKPVVLRFEGSQPIYNPRFVDFATYYEHAIRICRPGHPNDKPRVERSFWELERSFFNGRSFRDEADLRAQLRLWMADVSDVRRHTNSDPTPLERFAEEQPQLRSLPSHHYDTARVLYRHCDIEGFVAWETNRYSVPYEHVTDILPVRITRHEILVYAADLRLLARHELRAKGASEDAELAEHHPRRQRGPDLEQLRKAFAEMGSEAAEFLARLETYKSRSASYHARHVLLLRQRFSTQDLLKALAHALRFDALDHAAVERILEARAPQRQLDEYVAQQIEQRLGDATTTPRDLAEYDALPCWHKARPEPGESRCHEPSEPSAVADAEAHPSPPPPAGPQQNRATTPRCSSDSDSTANGCD